MNNSDDADYYVNNHVHNTEQVEHAQDRRLAKSTLLKTIKVGVAYQKAENNEGSEQLETHESYEQLGLELFAVNRYH